MCSSHFKSIKILILSLCNEVRSETLTDLQRLFYLNNMIKPTRRKGFNFLRSYFDVLNEIEKKEDKFNYLMAIINKQFLNEDPKDANFMVNLCYQSQRHAIESSVKGWLTAHKGTPITDPPPPSTTNPLTDPKEEEVQVQEKEEVQEKGKGECLKPSTEGIDFTKLLLFFNSTFNKKSRTVSLNVRNKYKARLKEGFTKEDIFTAMKNASQSNYHKGENFNHCTLEFFSRADKLDKYINFKEQKNGFKKDTIANQPDYAKGKRKDFTKTTF